MQAGLLIGFATETFATTMRAPIRRGRADGPAYAREVSQLDERWSDGRSVAHKDWEQIDREIADAEYMRPRVARLRSRVEGPQIC
jgi:hypothetical protein